MPEKDETKNENHLTIETLQDLEAWLEANHRQKESLWLVTFKKGSGRGYVPYDEVVDLCLCYGWVDSQIRKVDELRSKLRISPRNPKSNWSRVNKEKVARLQTQGRMQPAGQAMIDLAKARGTWDFLNDVEEGIIPQDLLAALNKAPQALTYFENFPRSSRRGILEWLKTAKTEATRRKRIEDIAQKAAQNIKANFPEGRNLGPKLK
jgi:uncharacterized protein YdeI (YjbR/CyaY-like superfamily)